MIPGIFDNPTLFRMGWALLHFLWQGTLIALALKGALMLIEQRSSRLRYALAPFLPVPDGCITRFSPLQAAKWQFGHS